MKNISFQCLPQVYLVPKKFHCGLTPSPQLVNQEYTNYLISASKPNLNAEQLDKSEKWLLGNDDNIDKTSAENTDIMYRKGAQVTAGGTSKHKDRLFAHEKLTQSFHIVCKATQSERITQFQLITSNKLENIYNEKENDTKWCPVDFYERPRQPFRRYDVVNVTYKEPILKSLLLKDVVDSLKKLDKPINLPSLNILYDVTSKSEDSVHITSFIDPSSNKAFLQLLEHSESDEQWEDILKLVETQLGENFRKMFVQIEASVKKK